MSEDVINSVPGDKMLPVFIYCGGFCANPEPVIRLMSEHHKCATCGSDNYVILKPADTDALKTAKSLQDRVCELEEIIASKNSQIIEQQKSVDNLEEQLHRLKTRRKSTAAKIKRRVMYLKAEIRRLRKESSWHRINQES